jgi:hypothetical protein
MHVAPAMPSATEKWRRSHAECGDALTSALGKSKALLRSNGRIEHQEGRAMSLQELRDKANDLRKTADHLRRSL